jgi:hypothetical protein
MVNVKGEGRRDSFNVKYAINSSGEEKVAI